MEVVPSVKEEIQHSNGSNLKRNNVSLLKQNEPRLNIRNQSAISDSEPIMPSYSSYKLTSNMIANIFDDFFNQYK